MMSPETNELIRILAGVDATFAPMPNPLLANSCCAEIFHRRESYHRGEGIPWVVGGSADARRGGEKVLSELKRGGLIVLPRRKGEHRRVGLTSRGCDCARQLAGHPTAADCWPLLRGIVEAVADRRGVGPEGAGVWLLERQLLDGTGGDVATVRALTLPLFVRGFIRVGIDSAGGLYFTSTVAGVAAAAGPAPEPRDTMKPMPEAGEVYLALADFLKARSEWRTVPNNCFIPFPARGPR
jgi:hypothetical protein